MASASTPTACTSLLRQVPSPASKDSHCVCNNLKTSIGIAISIDTLLPLLTLAWTLHHTLRSLTGILRYPKRTLKDSNNINTSNGTLFASIRNLPTVSVTLVPEWGKEPSRHWVPHSVPGIDSSPHKWDLSFRLSTIFESWGGRLLLYLHNRMIMMF